MSIDSYTIAFIGLGEAASSIISGWGNLRNNQIKAYDIKLHTVETKEEILARAKELNIQIKSSIQDLVKDKNIKCIFSEPQFNPKLINMIAKSSGAETGILDPLGSSYKPGKDLYFNLINDLYENLNKC